MSGKFVEKDAFMKIGVSSCLLGNQVRFDSGHKFNRFVVEGLGHCFKLVPFCPEMAIGMSVPRQPIRLVSSSGALRAVGVRDAKLDVTDRLIAYGQTMSGTLAGLSGFVVKKDSPSCGMARVKVYNHHGMAERNGTGLFTRELMRLDPLLPIEEEGRLNDAMLRENFVMRVLVYARWKQLTAGGLSKGKLLQFHTRHKYLLMAHDETMYRSLGRMLADLGGGDLEAIAGRYVKLLMPSLSRPATRKRHTNVLQHLMGFLKQHLGSTAKADLAEAIEAYRQGYYPLIVPVRLLTHHFNSHPHRFVEQQTYLEMHPLDQLLALPQVN